MGKFNSSKTRIEPVFDELRKQDASLWLPVLRRMAIATRGAAVPAPTSPGPLRPGKVYERTLPPSTAFLRWMVQNPGRLTPLPPPDYGATPGGVASRQRAAVFGADPQPCFETDECIVLIEGKRTEAVSPSTRWFRSRNQLWRNVEVAGELAAGRQFGVILGSESAGSGKDALQEAERSRDGSYPHLSTEQRRELDRHLLGFVVLGRRGSAVRVAALCVLRETC